jgi:hypothetical protein
MSTTLPITGEPTSAPPPGPPFSSDLFTRQVSPAIQRSLDAFRAALPELLKNKTAEQEWVAFCGDELVTFGRTKTEAYHECLQRGLKRGTFIVMGVDPEINEFEIMHDV